MQGKLYRRPGSLLYWFGYTDDRGFPVEHCTGTYDYAEAEIIAAQIGGPSRDQTSTATHARKAGAILIAECIARYVDAARLDLSPATVECYEQKGGHLVRLLGDLYLSKLSLDHVATYCKVRLQEGAARESVRKEGSSRSSVGVVEVGFPWRASAACARFR